MGLEIIFRLRHQHRRSAHGQSHIQRQIPGAAAHHLHHRAALVGLHGVPQPVNALHRGVGGSIESDGVIGANNVVINGTGNAHHRNAPFAQILGAPEGAVAADGHNAVQSQQLAGIGGFLLPLLCAELLAAGRVQYGAAAVDDAADAGAVHLHKVTVDQSLPATADPHHLNAAAQGAAHHGTDGGVHSRRVTAGGQYTDAFYCVFHIEYTSSIMIFVLSSKSFHGIVYHKAPCKATVEIPEKLC